MMQAVNTARKIETAAPSPAVEERKEEGFVVPPLEELVKESPVAQELSPRKQTAAFNLAQQVDFEDPTQAMNFGLEEQQAASAVTRKFLDEVREANLDKLVEIALDQNRKMEQLNIGELEPGKLERVLGWVMPQKQAAKVKSFLDKHKGLSELIDTGQSAMAEERVELQELRGRMAQKIEENQGVYESLTGKIAAAELGYAANKRKVAEFKERNQDTRDAAVARQLGLMDKALAMQARRINSLKASRQETLNALNTMDLQVQRIDSQIQMIDEQTAFNRLVWDNTVMMLATDRQMRDSVEAVKYNRESIERMMKNRGGSIAETLRRIIQEEKTGVINAAVLEYAAQELIRMNRTIIEGNKEIRDCMAQADAVIQRLDAHVKGALSHAAVMTDKDVADLDAYLKEALPEVPAAEKAKIKAAAEKK